MARKKKLADFIARQDSARGMGLARDVKAGQASPVPPGLSDAARRRANRPRWERTRVERMPRYRKSRTVRS